MLYKIHKILGMVTHIFSPRQVDPWIWAQPGLYSKVQNSQDYIAKACLQKQQQQQQQNNPESFICNNPSKIILLQVILGSNPLPLYISTLMQVIFNLVYWNPLEVDSDLSFNILFITYWIHSQY